MSAKSRPIFSGLALISALLCLFWPPGVPAQSVPNNEDRPIPTITAMGMSGDHPGPVREEFLVSGQVPLLPAASPETSALADLKIRFSGELGRLLSLIGQEADPLTTEELQKQCQTIKAQEERAVLDLKANQAEARGDAVMAAAIRDGINTLEKTSVAGVPEDRPIPDPNAAPPVTQVKTPDEL